MTSGFEMTGFAFVCCLAGSMEPLAIDRKLDQPVPPSQLLVGGNVCVLYFCEDLRLKSPLFPSGGLHNSSFEALIELGRNVVGILKPLLPLNKNILKTFLISMS